MKVFSYFEQIPGMKPDHLLVDQWQQSWRHFGWEPVMLTRNDAEYRGPAAVHRILASAELGRGPCPEGYNYATHLQWVAHPGGLKVDFDVINNGFTTDMMQREAAKHDPLRPIFLNACNCCCAVYAEEAAAAKLLARILQHEEEARMGSLPDFLGGELPMVCHDQAIFGRFANDWQYPAESYVVEFGNENWRNAPLIHFCNSKTVSPRGRTVGKLGLRGLR